jgi:hypothetical protein
MAKELQAGLVDPERVWWIFEAFRGMGKSVILAAFACWCFLWDQRLNIMVTSAGQDKADDFAYFIQKLLGSMPELEHLRPKHGNRSKANEFDVGGAPASQTPSLRSVAVFGTYTGGRADLILADDLEAPRTAETIGMRAKLWQRTSEFTALLKPPQEGLHKVLALGTNHAEESYYNRCVSERNAHLIVYPVTYPDPELAAYYGVTLQEDLAAELAQDPSLAGQPTDPERFSAETIVLKRSAFGQSEWNKQYLLDPRAADAEKYPLKLKDLIVEPLDMHQVYDAYTWSGSERQELKKLSEFCAGFDRDRYHSSLAVQGSVGDYVSKVLYVDPSGQGLDETAWAVVGFKAGSCFLLGVGGFLDGFGIPTLEGLARKAKLYGVDLALLEKNYGGGMFGQLLQPHLARIAPGVGLEEVQVSGQKETRIIDALQPVMQSHRLVVHEDAIVQDFQALPRGLEDRTAVTYRAFYQMARITKDRQSLGHDDRLEAIAGAVSYFQPMMGLDPEAEAQKAMQAELDEQVRWTQNMLGRPKKAKHGSVIRRPGKRR